MRLYTEEFTGKQILLNPADVWYHADEERLLGIRNTTIYMHYTAWKRMTGKFATQCTLRNIEIEVVF